MPKVTFKIEGSLGIITMNNPPLNLLTQEVVEELAVIVGEVPRKYLRGLVFKSRGNFSAGANMSLFSGKDRHGGREILDMFLGNIVRKIEVLPYPTLAAVSGMCLGGGFELALACDIIWAGNEAKFGAVEGTIGTVPLGAGSRMIASRAGVARAKEMVFEAKIYGAEQLEKWNIVNKVVADGDLEEQAMKYIKRLAEGPTSAHAVTKRLHSEYFYCGLNSSDDLLLEIVPPLFETHDFIDGIKSLIENGPGKAKFKGE